MNHTPTLSGAPYRPVADKIILLHIMLLNALSAALSAPLVLHAAPNAPHRCPATYRCPATHRCPATRLCAADAAEPHVAALLESLAITADGTFNEAAAASLLALETIEVDYNGYDIDPAGRWRVLSFDALRCQCSELGVPLMSSVGSCSLSVSGGGPADFQNDIELRFEVVPQASGERIQMACRGVVALSEEHASVVFLRADMQPVEAAAAEAAAESAMQAVEAAVLPILPPGAIRSRLDLAWIDETVCVLRDPETEGGIIVLQRLSSDGEETPGQGCWGDAEDAEGEDEDDGMTTLWVGSPY